MSEEKFIYIQLNKETTGNHYKAESAAAERLSGNGFKLYRFLIRHNYYECLKITCSEKNTSNFCSSGLTWNKFQKSIEELIENGYLKAAELINDDGEVVKENSYKFFESLRLRKIDDKYEIKEKIK